MWGDEKPREPQAHVGTRRASCYLMSFFWGHRFKLPSSPQPVDTAAGHIWEMGREDPHIGLRLPSVLCGEKRHLGLLRGSAGSLGS